MRFFIDNNLPPSFAPALHALSRSEFDEHEVIHLREKFDAVTKDEIWIAQLALDPQWVVITHDRLNKGLEREALRRAGLMVFFLDRSWKDHDYWDKAQNLVRWWPRILEQSAGVTGQAAFAVSWNFRGKGQFKQVVF